MAARVRESHLVVTDDTVLPMLSPGKTQRARMWVYVGDASNPYNVFDFTLNRRRDGPKHFLKEYQQVLLADGYDGYNGVVAGNGITRSGCWSHVRRKVCRGGENGTGDCAGSSYFGERALCLEKQAKDVSVAERRELRQAQSTPVLAELRRKLLLWKEQLIPKHPMADAVNYTLNQWAQLNVFCSDGAVPIDNNASGK
jgi:transposase